MSDALIGGIALGAFFVLSGLVAYSGRDREDLDDIEMGSGLPPQDQSERHEPHDQSERHEPHDRKVSV